MNDQTHTTFQTTTHSALYTDYLNNEENAQPSCNLKNEEHMNIVFVGHVDHGKSTLIGRLLAETNTLPKGKLEKLQRFCAQNSKPFEYAFLLDALGDEQAQGITIDIARCFFRTKQRHYLVLDAPGHIEFLKNLITGAANAEAAFLVIDAKEGIQENSRRHAYMLSMLGVSQVVVLVNKIDLADYSESIFNTIKNECSAYLKQMNIEPSAYIPVSGREGDNIIALSHQMPWYQGPALVEALDGFCKQLPDKELAFRMPVQDIYKFTLGGDHRRIIAGQVLTGTLKVGDRIVFYPSGKQGTIKTIEAFNQPSIFSVDAGFSTGFILHEQLYIKRGEVACVANQKKPQVALTLVTFLFWLGHTPLQLGKVYWFKLGTARVKATIEKIEKVFDTASLNVIEKASEVKANQAAECILKLDAPIAFDDMQTNKIMARFVLIDHYDIGGGGMIKDFIHDALLNRQSHLQQRNQHWVTSKISLEEREQALAQKSLLIIITGDAKPSIRQELALALESVLFSAGKKTYFMGIGNVKYALDSAHSTLEDFHRFGEILNILLDTGLIVIAAAAALSKEDINLLKMITERDTIISIWIGSKIDNKDHYDGCFAQSEPIAELVNRIQQILIKRCGL